ncbi:hypothetical protein QQF64_022204 [Cirrhinus molitorella]|uniref:ribonuclease H n=1 Tax=Cirrhinus molitorella TaxID=172907 RepID=A0ABR3L7I8_9TELE
MGQTTKNTLISPGSTVIVEPTSSKSMPQNILVGRVITPMWGDGYIPMKIMNLSDQPMTLKRNCMLADVSPCVAAEDFTVFQNTSQVETKDQLAACPESSPTDLNFTQLLCYLDDLIVFAATEKEALSRLEVVFQRLRQHNLKLSPKKCHLLQTSVRFLGHVIERGGVAVDPEKVDVISRMTMSDLMEDDGVTPSVKRIKSFLGIIFYYQHFIANCFAIARPLFTLTAGQKGKGRGKITKQAGTFKKIKKPLTGQQNASLDGLGAVLSQIPLGEDKARPITFASKTLSTSQKRYPAYRLEFLALKWSVCEKFSHWLKGNTFTVCMDNNPLTYIMTKPKLDACKQRWVAKLAPYTFEIRHIAGNKNVVADVLSRDLFAKTISLMRLQRLLNEQYKNLLSEAEGVSEEGIQDTFRLKVSSPGVRD